jgi:hypothetical protein
VLEFEWDRAKAKLNLKKHRIAFKEAATVFGDPLSVTVYDPAHSEDEDRYLTVGTSEQGKYIVVAHTDRGDRTRIISARELRRAELKDYEDQIKKRRI